MINLHINCPNIRDIPNNQIPLQKVGDYWGFDTLSVTVQYTETIAVLKVSSEVIKCPTIGAASFGQSPYVARLLPVRGVVGHNIDRCITRSCCKVLTPQRHRYTGAVGSHLNYPRTEYDAPTASSSRDRTGTKTHFESRRHADPAMFTNHT